MGRRIERGGGGGLGGEGGAGQEGGDGEEVEGEKNPLLLFSSTSRLPHHESERQREGVGVSVSFWRGDKNGWVGADVCVPVCPFVCI
jgi:hypothetical protein